MLQVLGLVSVPASPLVVSADDLPMQLGEGLGERLS